MMILTITIFSYMTQRMEWILQPNFNDQPVPTQGPPVSPPGQQAQPQKPSLPSKPKKKLPAGPVDLMARMQKFSDETGNIAENLAGPLSARGS